MQLQLVFVNLISSYAVPLMPAYTLVITWLILLITVANIVNVNGAFC